MSLGLCHDALSRARAALAEVCRELLAIEPSLYTFAAINGVDPAVPMPYHTAANEGAIGMRCDFTVASELGHRNLREEGV